MTTVDIIEMLGESVDGGLIDRPEAEILLSELSGGGLTVIGARDLLGRWREVRLQYERLDWDRS